MEVEVSLADENSELTQHAISDVMSPERPSFREEPLGKEPSPVHTKIDEQNKVFGPSVVEGRPISPIQQFGYDDENVVEDLINEPISTGTSPEKTPELIQHLTQSHMTENVELSQHVNELLNSDERSGCSLWTSRPGTVIERKNPNVLLIRESGDEHKYSGDFNGESIDVQPIVDSRISIGDTIVHTQKAPISSSTPAVHKEDSRDKSDSGQASPDSGEFGGSKEEREMKEMLNALKADIQSYSVPPEKSRVGSASSSASSKESGVASRCTNDEEKAIVFHQIPVDLSVVSDVQDSFTSPAQHLPRSTGDYLGQKVAVLLSQAPKDAESYVDSNNSALANSTRESEREDIERITSRYRSLLRDEAEGSGPIELNTSDESSVNIPEAKPEVVNVIIEGGTALSAHSVQSEGETSGSESEDGINRDVKSILMKYGHAFSDSESEVDRGFGLNRMDEKNFAKRIEDLVMGPGGDMMMMSQSGPRQVYDDPAKSMSLPNLADTSADSNVEVKRKPDVQESEDDLGHRVRDILSNTSHLKKAKDNSKPSSIASSIDFGALEKDLNEIIVELDSLKSEGSQKSSSSSYQALPGGQGASDVEDVVEEEPPKESNRPLINLGVDPLLTSGVIPLDLALEIVHSANYDSSGRPKVSLDGSLASQRFHNQSRVDSSINDVLENEEHSVDSEVEDVIDQSRPPTAASGQSLTERVQNILERSSPPRQAYRYLEEANRQQERLMERSDHEQSLDILKGALQGRDSSYAVSPFRHMTPFNKLEGMRGLFSHQVQSMKEVEAPSVKVFTANAQEKREEYEREFEMRRQHIEQQQRIVEEEITQAALHRITPTEARLREIEEPRSSPTLWREPPKKEEGGVAGRVISSPGLTTFDSRLLLDSLGTRQSPNLVPYKPKGGDDVYFINIGKYDGDISLDALNQISLDNSQTDPGGSGPPTNSTTSPEQNIPDVRSRDPRLRLLLQHQQRSSSRESSLTPPSARRPRSPVSDSSFRRTSPPPVRRRTHHDGAVMSSCEDGSVAGLSETTVESTHPGSDDARAPSFPSHLLGTRPDPTSNSLGIYGTQKQSPLGPIEEQPSVCNLNDSHEDITPSATRTLEGLEKSRRFELQERSFKKAETWVQGNFSPGAYKVSVEQEKKASAEGSVGDILSETSEEKSDFGTPKKAERTSDEKMAYISTSDYHSGAQYSSLQPPLKESSIRKQREEVMRKFGYTKPLYVSEPAFESTSAERFEPLPSDEDPQEDNYYEPARLSHAMDGLRGFSTYADQSADQSDNSVNTDELLARIRGRNSMPSPPQTSPSFKTLSPVPLPPQESREAFLRSTSPLPRIRPRSPPYNQIQGPDGPADNVSLEQHFEEIPGEDVEIPLPLRRDVRREERRPASPERNLSLKSPNVVECSPNVIQKSPSREMFRSVDTSGQDAVREIRDREFHRLLETAQQLTGRESPELRLPRNMEAAWQRFQEQRRSLELSRERRSMESSKNSAKDFSTERSANDSSDVSLSQLKSSTADASDTSPKSKESPELGASGQQHPRKMAWIIRDETLASVPEDSTLDSVTSDLTTSSEVDSDGKVITHTTRKHLPDDPKLLKLQRKVAQQREKHRLDRHNSHKELHRQEKIQTMERLLRAQERALRDLQRQSDVSSTTITGSDITDDSTLNETPDVEDEPIREDFERPAALQLQQVDYSRSERAPWRKHSPAKRPSSKKNKENEERKISKETPKRRTRGEIKIIKDQNNADVYIKRANTQDFGATCPTPDPHQSPKRKYNTINMVSEGVQTTPQRSVPRKTSPSRRSQATSPSRAENLKMFIPEAALKKRHKLPARLQKPKPAVSWFVPVVKRNPPFKERQNEAPPNFGAWILTDDDLKPSLDYQRPSLPKREVKCKHMTSLQEAFEKNKMEFISASRERQKHVAIRAEERRVQELHHLERAKLFGLVQRKRANRDAHPISEDLFKPKQRFMTRQEMKEMTQRKYKQLPEVVKAAEDRKRSEEYRLNRLRAKLYQKRIQNMALKKPTPWLRA